MIILTTQVNINLLLHSLWNMESTDIQTCLVHAITALQVNTCIIAPPVMMRATNAEYHEAHIAIGAGSCKPGMPQWKIHVV